MSPAPSVRTTSPGSKLLVHVAAHLGSGRLEPRVGTCSLRGVSHLLAADSRDRLLPCRIDLGNEDYISHRQRLTHGLPVRRGPRVEMGLKNRHQPPPGKGLTGRREGGGELRRVVSVVVYHGNAAELSQSLEAATHTVEVAQSCGRRARALHRARRRPRAPLRRYAGCGDRVPSAEAAPCGRHAHAIRASVETACWTTSLIRMSASLAQPNLRHRSADPCAYSAVHQGRPR